MKKLLILIRGLPGSGKSTLASKLANSLGIQNREADAFFTDKDGQYHFNAQDLGKAHSNCRELIEKDLEQYDVAICSNTNVAHRDLYPYIEIAELMGAFIWILEPDTAWAKDPKECFNKCLHRCPLENIKKMQDRWIEIKETLYDPVELRNILNGNLI